MEITPEETRRAFGKLPRPIREFISEGGLSDVIKSISSQYNLHVDVSGQLNQLMTTVLLGLVSPAALPEQISSKIGIPSAQVGDFIKELNVKIFIPLQKRVREEGPEPSREERIKDSLATEGEVVGKPIPTTPTIPPMSLSIPTPSVQAPEMPVYNLARPNASIQISTQESAPVRSEIRTMQHDIELHNATPARSFQTTSIPYTQQPQAAYLQSNPEVRTVEQVRTPLPQGAAAPETISAPQTSTSDPYREPIQ